MGSFLNFVEIIEYIATEDGKCLMKQDWSCKTHIGRYIDGWFESQFLGICRKNAQDGIKGMTQSYFTKDPYDPLVRFPILECNLAPMSSNTLWLGICTQQVTASHRWIRARPIHLSSGPLLQFQLYRLLARNTLNKTNLGQAITIFYSF